MFHEYEPHTDGSKGVYVEFAVPAGEQGRALVEGYFTQLEEAVNQAVCYRGKVLSLEANYYYTGQAGEISVHKLHSVDKSDIILPERHTGITGKKPHPVHTTTSTFIRACHDDQKGLLFYGPPGTGKTHTIHYLARHMEAHTTLLITAEQVCLFAEYLALARLLQPLHRRHRRRGSDRQATR